MSKAMIEFAQGYLDVGFSPIPLKRNKRPYIKWEEFQQRRPTVEEIDDWWHKYPMANIGLVTGKSGNLLVLDIESKKGLDALYHTVPDIPETIRQRTGRDGGLHFLFKHPRDGVYGNWAKQIPDVDFRGDGGYIMVAPSIHPNGKAYAWDNIDPLEDGVDDLMDLGDDLHKFLRDNASDSAGGLSKEDKNANPEGWLQELMLYGIETGARNDTMCKIAGHYVGKNPEWDKDHVLSETLCFNYEYCKPPLPRNEIVALVNSICSRNEAKKVTSNEKLVGSVLEQQLYPDDSCLYHLYLSSKKNDYIELSPSELLSCRAYKTKVMVKTGEIISHQSQKQWDIYIQTLMDKMVVKVRGIDESPIGKVVEVIEKELQSGRVTDDYTCIKKKACIVRVHEIKINITGIENALTREGVFNMPRKELTGYLRRLGFVPRETSYHDAHIKVNLKMWTLHETMFAENIRLLQKGSDIEAVAPDDVNSFLEEIEASLPTAT